LLNLPRPLNGLLCKRFVGKPGISMPRRKNRILPPIGLAQIGLPAPHERRQQIGLLKDLIKAVGRILMQFRLSVKIIGDSRTGSRRRFLTAGSQSRLQRILPLVESFLIILVA
jgi:hypothetical protein